MLVTVICIFHSWISTRTWSLRDLSTWSCTRFPTWSTFPMPGPQNDWKHFRRGFVLFCHSSLFKGFLMCNRHSWMDAWTDECMGELMNDLPNEWVSEWMNGLMNEDVVALIKVFGFLLLCSFEWMTSIFKKMNRQLDLEVAPNLNIVDNIVIFDVMLIYLDCSPFLFHRVCQAIKCKCKHKQMNECPANKRTNKQTNKPWARTRYLELNSSREVEAEESREVVDVIVHRQQFINKNKPTIRGVCLGV